jgi:hypothetical protein
MKLSHLLELFHTMEPDATVTIGVLTVGHIEDVRITHAEQIGAGTQAVIRLTPEDDLTID